MTMHELATKLFKIPRSITGEGFRKSLNIIKSSKALLRKIRKTANLRFQVI